MTSKLSALEEFSTRKTGDGDVSNSYRERLERDIDSMQASLKQANEANKPPPPPPPKESGGSNDNLILGILGHVKDVGLALINRGSSDKNKTD